MGVMKALNLMSLVYRRRGFVPAFDALELFPAAGVRDMEQPGRGTKSTHG